MSDDPWDDPEVKEFLDHANRHLRPMVAGSHVGIPLINGAKPDAKMAVELGMILLLDKPLILAVSPGVKVPHGLVKAADAIVEVDYADPDASRDSLSAAIERVMADWESDDAS